MAVVKLNVLHVHATDSESFPLVIPKRPEFLNLSFSTLERYNAISAVLSIFVTTFQNRQG